MGVEWDEEKREANIKKHGVDFYRAAKIFANPVVECLDDREDYGEDRIIATGHWEDDYCRGLYAARRKSSNYIGVESGQR